MGVKSARQTQILQRYDLTSQVSFLNSDFLKYMLEVIGAGNPDYKGQDWGDVWASSPESKRLSEELENIISTRRNMRENEETRDDREFAMPLYVQIVAVTKRAFVAYWRLPDYILASISSLTLEMVQALTLSKGQVHASHLHRAFQYLHLLAFRKQLHRHAIKAVFYIHDPDDFPSSHPAITAKISPFSGSLRVARVQIKDLLLGGIRRERDSPRTPLLHCCRIRLLQLLVSMILL